MKIQITPSILLAMVAAASQAFAAKVPTAYSTGGGGFKTMTESMGIIRAFNDAGLLEDRATHFGCCSGGCWFQTQFSYSPTFYADTLGFTNKTVQEHVSDWGVQYGASVKKATVASLYNDATYEFKAQSDQCVLEHAGVNNASLIEVVEAAVNIVLGVFAFPATDWFYYIESLIETTLVDPSSTYYSTTRGGFPDGTIVAMSTLAPDIWDNQAESTPYLIGGPDGVDLLPISYVAPPDSNGEWVYPGTITQPLEVSNGEETVLLSLGLPKSLTEVNAASSSAGGFMGSPTLFNNLMTYVLDNIDNTTSDERLALEEAITDCAPFGLQNLSSPTEGNVESTTSSWSSKYRHCDGGYSECTSIPSTISSMQNDCSSNSTEYDCSEGIRFFSIFGAYVTSYNATQRLFSGCDCGTTNYPYLGDALDPAIFEERFPSFPDDSGWTVVSNVTYDWSVEPSVTYAWRGTVTTIDNPGFNVVAGTKVDLVLLYVDVPDTTATIWPGWNAESYFSDSYAVIAQEMYDSMLHYFEDLSQDWATAPTRKLLRGSNKGGAQTFRGTKQN